MEISLGVLRLRNKFLETCRFNQLYLVLCNHFSYMYVSFTSHATCTSYVSSLFNKWILDMGGVFSFTSPCTSIPKTK